MIGLLLALGALIPLSGLIFGGDGSDADDDALLSEEPEADLDLISLGDLIFGGEQSDGGALLDAADEGATASFESDDFGQPEPTSPPPVDTIAVSDPLALATEQVVALDDGVHEFHTDRIVGSVAAVDPDEAGADFFEADTLAGIAANEVETLANGRFGTAGQSLVNLSEIGAPLNLDDGRGGEQPAPDPTPPDDSGAEDEDSIDGAPPPPPGDDTPGIDIDPLDPGDPEDEPSNPEPTVILDDGREDDQTPPDTGSTEILDSYISGEPGGYNIEILFNGVWTAPLQQAFIEAADYLSDVILGDVPDIGGATGSDDITIEANLIEIDGPQGVLGRAGPTYVRVDSGLPTQGLMEFDSADAELYRSEGLWMDIVLHEMMHTLGLGTLWGYLGMTTGSIAGGDLRFTGEMATEQYQTEFAGLAEADPGAALGVPVETDGGEGTAGGHWDEARFDNELATGYIDPSNYVSDMTLASFDDLGYDTFFDDPGNPGDAIGVQPADPVAIYA